MTSQGLQAKNVLIRASAGTGKTYQLAQRYLRLLRVTTPDRILATTFTRKAAGEILERILSLLAKPDDANATTESASEDRYALLKEFTRRLHRVHIGTLDSYFVNVGTSIALEVGLPAGWRVIDEHEQAQIRLRAIESLLQTESTADVMRLMLMLFKGEARQGVTDQLLDSVEKFHDLYLATAPDAWQRLPSPAGLSPEELNAAIDEFSKLALPKNKHWTDAHDEAADSVERRDWEAFVGKGIAKAILEGKGTYYSRRIPEDFVLVYDKLIRHARAVVVNQLRRRNQATWELLQRYHSAWSEITREVHGETFTHITMKLAEYFASHPIDEQHHDGTPLSRVAYRIDSPIDQLLLDEFQDTSIAQWNALSRLATHVAGSDTGGFFCVGDEKQAIYGWRGGRSELFAHLHERLPDLSIEVLNESRRSARPVIDTVNEVFQNALRHPGWHDDEREAIAEFVHRFPVHTTVQPFEGYAVLVAAEVGDNEAPDVAVYRTVVDLVRDLQSRAAGCEIGILTRTNQVVGHLVYELRQAGIDASEEGGTPITDSAAVQLILSALILADHPGDTVARFHVAQSALAETLGLVDHVDDDLAAKVAAEIRAQLVAHGYSRTLINWTHALSPYGDAREVDRLRQLIELADEYQPIATLKPADFIRFVSREKMESPSRSLVRVMTVHQAKGLQFDIALLAELEEPLKPKSVHFVTSEPDPFSNFDGMCLYVGAASQNLLPAHVQQMFQETARRGVRESLCLLYVAMTRAVRALYMVCPPAGKSLHRTFSGLLSAAMTGRGLSPGERVERGNRDWIEDLPKEKREPRQRSNVGAFAEPVRFAPGAPDEVKAQIRVAPSRDQLPGTVRLKQVLNLSSRRAQDRGTLIHAWFESIEWLDDGRPDQATLEGIADELDAQHLGVSSCRSQFQAMLSQREITYVLSRQSYLPPSLGLSPAVEAELAAEPLRLAVERERRFVFREEGAIVSGSIDRLVLMYRNDRLLAADILDFKTDVMRANGEDQRDRQAHYHAQLACYARAVAGIYQLAEHRISTRLVMLSTGRVETIDWRRHPESEY